MLGVKRGNLPRMFDQPCHLFSRTLTGGNNKIAFVLPVLIVCNDEKFAGSKRSKRLLHWIEREGCAFNWANGFGWCLPWAGFVSVIVVRGESYRHVQEVVSLQMSAKVTRARWDWLSLAPGTTRVTYSKVRWQNIFQNPYLDLSPLPLGQAGSSL